MSLWGCTQCHQLVHCSVSNICPQCGGACEIVNIQQPKFNTIEFTDRLNDILYENTKSEQNIDNNKENILQRLNRVLAIFNRELANTVQFDKFRGETIQNIRYHSPNHLRHHISAEIIIQLEGEQFFFTVVLNLDSGEAGIHPFLYTREEDLLDFLGEV